MTEEQRMLWMAYDAEAELTYNPLKRLYYRLKMRELERMDTKKKLVIRLDEDVHRAFKVACTKNDTSMNEVIEKFIKTYLQESEKQEKQS